MRYKFLSPIIFFSTYNLVNSFFVKQLIGISIELLKLELERKNKKAPPEKRFVSYI